MSYTSYSSYSYSAYLDNKLCCKTKTKCKECPTGPTGPTGPSTAYPSFVPLSDY